MNAMRNQPFGSERPSLKEVERAVVSERCEKEPRTRTLVPLPSILIDPINPDVTEALNALRMQMEAGVPLGRSLRTASPICKSATAQRCFLRAAEAVERSSSFDDALLEMSAIVSFPERAILSAGWSAGRIDPAMRAVIHRREVMYQSRKELRAKLMLPLAELFLAGFILNAPSIILGHISGTTYLVRSLAPFIVVMGFLMAIKWFQIAATRVHAGRELSSPVPPPTLIDRIVLKIPILSMVQRWRNRSEFASNMSTLLGAGLNTLAALDITARALPNGMYRKQIQESRKRVEKEGCTLAETLPRGQSWPAAWIASLEAAHEAGEEEKTLSRLGEAGRERYLGAVKIASFWFGFLVYLAVMGYIAFIIISFYMGYFSQLGV